MQFHKDDQLSWWIYWPSMAKIITRSYAKILLKKNQRSADQVTKEYDSGSWKKVLEDKTWLRHSSLQSYVTQQGEKQKSLRIIEGRVVCETTENYYTYKAGKLNEILERYAFENSQLLELGCGTGFNIFSLALSQPQRQLWGFDISKNGIQAAEEIKKHFSVNNVNFGHLDMIKGDANSWKPIAGKTVFTHFCLEQLTRAIPQVIENLIAAKPKRVIHLETSWDLLNGGLVDQATKLHVLGLDYQRNLAETLRFYETQGKLRVLEHSRMGFAPMPRNFPTLTVWEPTNT